MKKAVILLLIISVLAGVMPMNVFCAPTGLGEYVINTSTLNVRGGPGSSYNRLGYVYQGDLVVVSEIANGYWGRISYEGGEGWISLNYAVRTASKQFSMSEEGLGMLKKLEGYSKFAYWDYQQWSIGYGTRCEENEYPDGITEEEATELLRKVLKVYETYVDGFLDSYSVTVTQPQYDALVSFTYNLGNIWVRTDDFALRTILIDGIAGYSEQEIRDAFAEFVSAGGEVLSGLVHRRQTEADMFISGTAMRVAAFKDVNPDAWYADEVKYCFEKGYMNGMTEDIFSPNTDVTREQFVLILANIAGVDTDVYKDKNSGMTDVLPGRWYSGAVAWAVESGYVSGVAEGVFGCGQSIKRAALVRLLYLYAESTGLDTSGRADLTSFADFEYINHPNNGWMVTALEWAVFRGLISGVASDSEMYIQPGHSATRAQTARILMQYNQTL